MSPSTSAASATSFACSCHSRFLRRLAARAAPRASGPRAQPALVDADADVDPFPLHRAAIPALFAAAISRRRGSPAEKVARPLRVALRMPRRELPPRPDPALARSREESSLQALTAHVSEHDRVAARALELIPDDAVVCASNSLGAHLSARRRFLSFPLRRGRRWIAADETYPGYLDRWDRRSATADRARRVARRPAWRLVFDEDGVLVFRRASLRSKSRQQDRKSESRIRSRRRRATRSVEGQDVAVVEEPELPEDER